jgi:hypothetical protein
MAAALAESYRSMAGSRAPSMFDLSSEDAVVETVRHALGATPQVRVEKWYVRRDTYVAALVDIGWPVVVKLAAPSLAGSGPTDTSTPGRR